MSPTSAPHRVPAEISEAAYNIAKAWGCTCTPRVTGFEQDPQRNVLHITARHARGCRYDPAKVFQPPEEIDDEAIAESAARMKKLRQRNTRKYSNKRGTP